MNSVSHLSLITALLANASISAATPLTTGHADVGIGYEGGFDLHVHDEENDVEFAPDEALLVVGPAALQFSPGGAFSFLGPAGTPYWALPQSENPDLLFLGIGAEELSPDDWNGNITLSLTAVSGPGSFTLWNVDAFGQPSVRMDSANGITSADNVSVIPGGHAHYNWGFSVPGTYGVSLEATGLNVADGPQNSGPVVYTFEVVPEPGPLGLGALGLAAFAWCFRRRSGRPFPPIRP